MRVTRLSQQSPYQHLYKTTSALYFLYKFSAQDYAQTDSRQPCLQNTEVLAVSFKALNHSFAMRLLPNRM